MDDKEMPVPMPEPIPVPDPVQTPEPVQVPQPEVPPAPDRQTFKITKEIVDDHEASAKKTQTKLLLMFDDEVHAKKGIEKMIVVGRWAAVTGRLWQHFSKQALALKETISSHGIDLEADEDVSMEALQELMCMTMKPNQQKINEVGAEARSQRPVLDMDFGHPSEKA